MKEKRRDVETQAYKRALCGASLDPTTVKSLHLTHTRVLRCVAVRAHTQKAERSDDLSFPEIKLIRKAVRAV